MRIRQILLLLVLAACARPGCAGAETGVADRVRGVVEAYAAQGRIRGSVLVALGGEVVYSGGHGAADATWGIENEPGTAFRLGSLSKQFTAAVALQLVEEGELELHAPIGRAMPGLAPEIGRRVTLHHLLSHTSGLPLDLVAFSDGHDKAPLTIRDSYSSVELLDLVNQQRPGFEPGSAWRYSNTGYVLVALACERVEGAAWGEIVRRRLCGPLGLSRTSHAESGRVTPRLASGYRVPPYAPPVPAPFMDPSFATGSGSMTSTTEDLFRWERALRAGRVVSPEMTALMQTPAEHAEGFGYGWRIDSYARDGGEAGTLVQHRGSLPGFNNTIDRYIEDDLVVIILTNQMVLWDMLDLRNALADAALGREPRLPPPPTPGGVFEALRDRGPRAAAEAYEGTDPALLAGHERELNQIGYFELGMGREQTAVGVFDLVTRISPGSANAFDSLGEACLAAGRLDDAEAAFRRVLALEPGNQRATEMLERIAARRASSAAGD